MQILDSLNLFRSFRMTGQEYINVEIAQFEGDETVAKEPKIVKNFRVFKKQSKNRELICKYLVTLYIFVTQS